MNVNNDGIVVLALNPWPIQCDRLENVDQHTVCWGRFPSLFIFFLVFVCFPSFSCVVYSSAMVIWSLYEKKDLFFICDFFACRLLS